MKAVRNVVTGLLLAVATVGAQAADHADAPGVIADPAADIADVYAWMTPDTNNVNLAMTVPAAAFSNAVQYVLHVESSTAYGTPGVSRTVICRFDASQNLECWVDNVDYLQGNASAQAGLRSATGRMLAFVGARNDPFFFNLTGFRNVISSVVAAAPSLTFDAAGCPTLDAATSNALIAQLQTGGDAFALGTVRALVLQIDKALIAPGGNIIAVWGSTRRS